MKDKQIETLFNNKLIANDYDESTARVNVKKKYYISDMGKCPRMRWVKRHGVESTFDPYVLWLLNIGNIFEDWGTKVLEASGRLLETQEYIETAHLKGKYDWIVKYFTNDEETEYVKRLTDCKSTGAYKMKLIKNGDGDEDNLKQVFTYLVLLRDMGRTDLDDAISLLYMNKEPGKNKGATDAREISFIEQSVVLTKKREEEIRQEIKEITSYWEEDVVPPCKCPGWMKPYNSYIHFCEASDAQVREYLKYLEQGRLISTGKSLTNLVDDVAHIIKS